MVLFAGALPTRNELNSPAHQAAPARPLIVSQVLRCPAHESYKGKLSPHPKHLIVSPPLLRITPQTLSNSPAACVSSVPLSGPSCFSVLAEQVNVDVASMLARAAKAQGVKNFVHVSALAADPDSPSRWAQTKVLRATFGARRVQDLEVSKLLVEC